MATVAAIGDDASKARADLGLDLRNDGLERVAVAGVARQRLHMGDELAALEAGGRMQRIGLREEGSN